MPLIYKILTAVIAFTGCAGLVITSQMNPLMLIPGIGLIPGYVRFWKGMPHLSRWTIGGLSITTLLLFIVDALIITGDMFIAVAHLTIVFQAIKSFDLKEPWDHLQVYFMSLLQLIIASELTRSVAFGAVFVVFLIALVTAMVISHFLKEGTIKRIRFRGPVIAISILTLIITTIFFISAPRTRGSIWGKSRTKNIKTAGFSERVDFGSFGEVKLDPTIVMRIEILSNKAKDTGSTLYWRGRTLNFFKGIVWGDVSREKERIEKQDGLFVFKPFSPERTVIQKILLEPLDSEIIFGLGNIAGVEIESRNLFVDNASVVFVQDKSPRRLSYTVYSVIEELPADDISNYHLQLPPRSERIEKLAAEVTKGMNSDLKKASGIEKYLKANYTYSLETSPPREGITPIEDFLFNSKKGYCEYYATAMALMLRSVGIPSRMVTGFIGGERNKYGGYIIVRQSDAHSWVEAVIDGRWKRFDPTPPAPFPEMPSLFSLYLDSLRMKWYRYVVSFSSSDQRRLIEYITLPLVNIPEMHEVRVYGVRTIIYFLIAISSITVIIFLLKQFRFRRHGFITENYLKFKNSLKRKGGKITLSSTPSDVVKEASRIGIKGDVVEFIRLYETARFGGRKLNAEDEERYKYLKKNLTTRR
ncbi:MAG: DUF3488 domain-containing protein [Nitrospirae bacterium]|nr:DUF3488 domain-containing protein [Nitrospirota bacterium]